MQRTLVLAIAIAITITSSARGAHGVKDPYPHVYQIAAAKCPGAGKARRLQTGFTMTGIKGIVTALHGVVGCAGEITATHKHPDEEVDDTFFSKLEIVFVDVAHDVAVLSSAETRELPGFAPGEAGASSGLKIIGHPHGVTSYVESTARSRGIVLLKTLVPLAWQGALISRSSPSVTELVLSVEGHITVGHSGAPVVNDAGEVVAVANGGLSNGATEITWAEPVSALTLTKYDKQDVHVRRLTTMPSQGLFTSTDAMPSVSSVRCFGTELNAVRTVSLGEVLEFVDDPATFQQLTYLYGANVPGVGFDVYRDANATINLTVPIGWTLSSVKDQECLAAAPAPDADIQINYRVDPLPAGGASTADKVVIPAEEKRFCSRGFVVDPSQSNPLVRPLTSRRIVSRRKTYLQIERRCNNTPPQMFPMAAIGSQQWSQLPTPMRTPGLSANQCNAFCPYGSYMYPDSWGAVPPEMIRAIGFGSYVASESLVLMSTIRTEHAPLSTVLASCLSTLSSRPACIALFERRQTWSLAALAATASSLNPR